MKTLFFFLLLSLIGCASLDRNKFTDPHFRIMVDPDSIEAKHYVRVVHSLQRTKKFVVVDRASGFNAIRREQQMAHRDNVDRFDDKEKWAHWGKLYGVGAVVVAQSNCGMTTVWWSQYNFTRCIQTLIFVDANTGEIMATAEDDVLQSTVEQVPPAWDDITEQLIADYPKVFEPNKDHPNIWQYRDESKELAVRQKEQMAAELP